MARKAKYKRLPGRSPSPEGRVSLNLTVRPGDTERLRAIGQRVAGRPNASAALMWLLDAHEADVFIRPAAAALHNEKL